MGFEELKKYVLGATFLAQVCAWGVGNCGNHFLKKARAEPLVLSDDIKRIAELDSAIHNQKVTVTEIEQLLKTNSGFVLHGVGGTVLGYVIYDSEKALIKKIGVALELTPDQTAEAVDILNHCAWDSFHTKPPEEEVEPISDIVYEEPLPSAGLGEKNPHAETGILSGNIVVRPMHSEDLEQVSEVEFHRVNNDRWVFENYVAALKRPVHKLNIPRAIVATSSKKVVGSATYEYLNDKLFIYNLNISAQFSEDDQKIILKAILKEIKRGLSSKRPVLQIIVRENETDFLEMLYAEGFEYTIDQPEFYNGNIATTAYQLDFSLR